MRETEIPGSDMDKIWLPLLLKPERKGAKHESCTPGTQLDTRNRRQSQNNSTMPASQSVQVFGK
jgi:hypothetical protein